MSYRLQQSHDAFHKDRWSVKDGRKTIARFIIEDWKDPNKVVEIAMGNSKITSRTTEYNVYGEWTIEQAVRLIEEAVKNGQKYISEGRRDKYAK